MSRFPATPKDDTPGPYRSFPHLTVPKSQLVSQRTTHLPMCLALLSGFPTVQERSREHSTCVIEPTRAWFKAASSKGCENEGMDAHLPRMLSHLSLSIPVFFCVCVCRGKAPSDSVYLLLCPGICITFQHVASA